MAIDTQEIIAHYYPEDSPLRQLLLKHSIQVRDKALEIMRNPVCAKLPLDADIVSSGAMLHDIGIGRCNAPSILCVGAESYIAHGVIGARLLREYGRERQLDLEPYARICERHTGTGITAREIREQQLPIPEGDYLPETLEEKLVCLADKFFSKSGDMQEKSLQRIRRSMLRFGEDTIERWDSMCQLFGL